MPKHELDRYFFNKRLRLKTLLHQSISYGEKWVGKGEVTLRAPQILGSLLNGGRNFVSITL
jgi:hypothetical protein